MHYCYKRNILRFIFLASSLFGLAGCGGGSSGSSSSQVTTNPSSAARTSLIAVGDANCPFGGILVETGIDDNGNGVLDTDEVNNSERVCNGATGVESLISINIEPSGVNCAGGGLRIDSGPDDNGNSILDSSEISQTAYVCNGSNGTFGWQTAERIQTGSAVSAGAPDVAVYDNGNAIAVWHQYDGTLRGIWSNRYVVGTGWGVAEQIDNNTQFSDTPLVSVDNNGNAIAVWSQYDGTNFNIWSNRYVAGIGWGMAEALQLNTEDATNLQLAVNSAGDAVAVWVQKNPGVNFNIWSNRYIAGTGWGVAELLETDVNDAFRPDVAIDDTGNIIAVWEQSDGTRFNAWANRYVKGTGWTGPTLLENTTIGVTDVRVAINSSGTAMAVWHQGDDIWSNYYDNVFGLWEGVTSLATNTGGAVYRPEVSINDNNQAVAIWVQANSVWSNRSSSREWGNQELIGISAGSAFDTNISILNNGEVFAVWRQFDGTNGDIVSNHYEPVTGWKGIEFVETSTKATFEPSFSSNNKGDAVTVWPQDSGTSNFTIWSNYRSAP